MYISKGTSEIPWLFIAHIRAKFASEALGIFIDFFFCVELSNKNTLWIIYRIIGVSPH